MASMRCSYTETSSEKFSQAKRAALAGVDLSRKGSIDAPIFDLVTSINAMDQFFTTSSCSGRTIVVSNFGAPTLTASGDDPTTNNVTDSTQVDGIQKKGCKWLYVTHDTADRLQVIDSLRGTTVNSATLKFEPFIMHVQCSSLYQAKQLLQVSVASGYRNSGISLGKAGKIILAVRSTAGLEVPLIHDGELLVSDKYVEFLVKQANLKMEDNLARVKRYGNMLTSSLSNQTTEHPTKPIKHHCNNSAKSKKEKPNKHLDNANNTKDNEATEFSEQDSWLFTTDDHDET